MSDQFREVTDLRMEKLLKAIELFRSYDPEIPAQVISVFLYIASHNNCSKVQIQDEEFGLNMASASASRNTDWLSHKHRLNKKGLNLIIKYKDPTDARKVILQLSKSFRCHFLLNILHLVHLIDFL